MNTFGNRTAGEWSEAYFSLDPVETVLTRRIDPHPFVPDDSAERSRRCELIPTMQAEGLATCMQAAHARKLVVGISGGLIPARHCCAWCAPPTGSDAPCRDVIAVTMPCFGTTVRTRSNAETLCRELGVDFRTVDITDSVNRHFADIGHDPENRNVVYENAQARERTQVLMDIANAESGLVVGTGDLSELALGWATYNGDHMSMYAVNASVPKTLVRHPVGYTAEQAHSTGRAALAGALEDILNTPVSPELLPATDDGRIAQVTEDPVGPYELHDFYLYYLLRLGARPRKLYRMARYALGGTYDDGTLLRWLEVFLRRFFAQQFKRSCLPDGPKIGSAALCARRLADAVDASAALWLRGGGSAETGAEGGNCMNLCDPRTIRDVMSMYGMTFRKELGQNFLTNAAVVEDIADACSDTRDATILEIGPGIGVLTQELGMRYRRVLSVEIDRRLVPLLRFTLQDCPPGIVEIINRDFMKADLHELLDDAFAAGSVSVCANLPYYITTPILMRLLESVFPSPASRSWCRLRWQTVCVPAPAARTTAPSPPS